MEILPVTSAQLDDVQSLFATSSITRGCRCMWFLQTDREASAGWGEGNASRFATMVRASPEPVGVLAYADGRAVGWCAAGPRSRYARVLRSPLTRNRATAEDDQVWMVPCFYVLAAARRGGLSQRLLDAAVALAESQGAVAVEGFPLAGAGPHRDDRYLGTEPLFAACGFRVVARPSARRVVMRRDLAASHP